MRLVALDLETTGLEPQIDQILQVGMLCFKAETGEVVGEFETLVRAPCGRYLGGAYALAQNAALLKRLADGEGIERESLRGKLHSQLNAWGFYENRPHAVGFNVAAFDVAFLKTLGKSLFHHRSIECGTLLMQEYETRVPVSSKVFSADTVAHTALADCYMARKAYLYAMGVE